MLGTLPSEYPAFAWTVPVSKLTPSIPNLGEIPILVKLTNNDDDDNDNNSYQYCPHLWKKKPYDTYYTPYNSIKYPSEYRKSPCKGLSALFIRSNMASKSSSVNKLNPLLALRDGRPCTQQTEQSAFLHIKPVPSECTSCSFTHRRWFQPLATATSTGVWVSFFHFLILPAH